MKAGVEYLRSKKPWELYPHRASPDESDVESSRYG